MVTTKKLSKKECKEMLEKAIENSNRKAKEINVLKFHLNHCILNAELEKKKLDYSIMPILFSAIKEFPLKKKTREFFKEEAGVTDWNDEFGKFSMETNNESYFVDSLLDAALNNESTMYLGSFNEFKKIESKIKIIKKDLDFLASLVGVQISLEANIKMAITRLIFAKI